MYLKSQIRSKNKKPPEPIYKENKDYSIKMKKPFLYNAEPVKSDAKPILARGPYDVYIGAIDEDKLPVYVVINRNTGVVEFTSEMTAFVNDWLDHFVKESPIAQGINEQLGLGLNS